MPEKGKRIAGHCLKSVSEDTRRDKRLRGVEKLEVATGRKGIQKQTRTAELIKIALCQKTVAHKHEHRLFYALKLQNTPRMNF